MFKKFSAAAGLSLICILGASNGALAAPRAAAAFCADPAVVAAIDSKETAMMTDNRLPGSGLALSSVSGLSGVHITDHQIQMTGGQSTDEDDVTICRIRMHLQARTANGLKEADQILVYRIKQLANSYAVTFCPNEDCTDTPAAVKLAGPAR